MPNTRVPAAAAGLPSLSLKSEGNASAPSRRLFLRAGRAAVVFATLSAAAAQTRSAIVVKQALIEARPGLTPQSYIADLRAAGYKVTLTDDNHILFAGLAGFGGFGEEFTNIHRRYEAAIMTNKDAWFAQVKVALRDELERAL